MDISKVDERLNYLHGEMAKMPEWKREHLNAWITGQLHEFGIYNTPQPISSEDQARLSLARKKRAQLMTQIAKGKINDRPNLKEQLRIENGIICNIDGHRLGLVQIERDRDCHGLNAGTFCYRVCEECGLKVYESDIKPRDIVVRSLINLTHGELINILTKKP
jgi:hypothetical protein